MWFCQPFMSQGVTWIVDGCYIDLALPCIDVAGPGVDVTAAAVDICGRDVPFSVS
jgi:hypothetical protein